MAEQIIQCSTECTVTVVHQISIPPFDLSVEAARDIGVAILLVWAIAWGYRQVNRLFTSSGQTSKED